MCTTMPGQIYFIFNLMSVCLSTCGLCACHAGATSYRLFEPPTGHAAGAEAVSPVPYRSFYLLIFTANVCCFIIEDEIQELDSNFFLTFNSHSLFSSDFKFYCLLVPQHGKGVVQLS